MHLLDADTLTHLHAQHPRVVERLRRCDDPEIGISIVTKAEVLRAQVRVPAEGSRRRTNSAAQHWLEVSEALLRELVIVPFGDVAVREFTKLQKQKVLKKIGHADLLAASIALANRATLVTRNLRHFRQIPNLDLDNWVDD